MGPGEELSYRTKLVRFKGRSVSILLQDVNGPCPLLSIANVLLLRNQLALPLGVGEVSEERLVQLVAGHLLDANSLEGREGVSEDYRANLQHSVSEVIALLPKLTTGIDVNLRFHDIRGFEFTNEAAVFDLLDIGLVHGWLCDPQDEATCCALGQKSYNELVTMLVTTLGGAVTPQAGRTPSASFRARHDGGAGASGAGQQQQGSGPQAALGATFEAAAGAQGGQGGSRPAGGLPVIQEDSSLGAQPIDASMLAAALHSSLQANPAAGGAGLPAGVSSPRVSSALGSNSMALSDSMRVLIDDMMAGLVHDAFAPTPDRQPGNAIPPPPDSPQPEHDGRAPVFGGAAAEPGPSLPPGEARPQEPPQPPATAVPDIAGMEWTTVLQLGAGGAGSAVLVADGGRTGELPSDAAGLPVGLQAPPGLEEEKVTLVLAFPDAGPLVEVELRVVQQQQQQRPGRGLLKSPFQSLNSNSFTALLGGSEVASDSQPSAAGSGESAAAPEPETTRSSGDTGPGPAALAAATPPPAAGQAAAPGPDEGAVHDALLVQQFLEGTPSQLTWHGLHALLDGLRENQLAVFFRNNHFNTILKYQGGLYLLVTDQGYQYEPDVVWEHLASVDGDTQFVDSEFRPFQPHAAAPAAAAVEVPPASLAPAAEFEGGGMAGAHVDADFALALQLQQEEQERAEREAEQRAQQAQRAAQQQQQPAPPPQRAGRPAATARPQQQQQQQAGATGSSSTGIKKLKHKVKEDCVIM